MKYTLFSIFFFLLTTAFVYSQEYNPGEINPRARDYFYKAAKLKRAFQYEKAEHALKKALEIDSMYFDAYMLLSDVYEESGQPDKSEEMLLKIVNYQADYFPAVYNLGITYLNHGKYVPAKKMFERFVELKDAPEKYIEFAYEKIKKAEYAITLVQNPVPFRPENLGPSVNSENSDYWPVLTADQEKIFITRKLVLDKSETGLVRYNEDVYYSVREGKEEWSLSSLAEGDLNSEFNNEGAITLTPDGLHMYFTGCHWENSYGRCDIYYSQKVNGFWTKPKNIGRPINSPAKETQPSISFDGNTLYFSSDRKGTRGKLDLWKSTKNHDGTWSVPVNLGNRINTSEDDESPFIHPDDHTLYFSSQGWPGLGMHDIYYARKQTDGNFSEAKNIGYPINNHNDQVSLFVTTDGRYAYFASDAEGGFGELDIYRFELYGDARPRPVTYIKGTITDAFTKEKLQARIELADVSSGENVITALSEEGSGEYLIPLQAGKDYAMTVTKKGYLFHSEHIPLKNYTSTKPFVKDVELQRIKEGNKVVLNNIFFEFDSYELKAESKGELSKLARFLNENPGVKIEIGGHTDNKGTDDYNEELSEKRAKEVYNYLSGKEMIDRSRLAYEGYGEKQPLRTNETEEGRAFNRRTEFKITEANH